MKIHCIMIRAWSEAWTLYLSWQKAPPFLTVTTIWMTARRKNIYFVAWKIKNRENCCWGMKWRDEYLERHSIPIYLFPELISSYRASILQQYSLAYSELCQTFTFKIEPFENSYRKKSLLLLKLYGLFMTSGGRG